MTTKFKTTGKIVLQHYQKYFYVVHANTPELKSMAYRLRYKVYAKEYGDAVFSSGREQKIETDEYDNEGLHALLFHKPTHTPIGCIRVIPYNEKSKKNLPLEQLCSDFDPNLITMDELRTSATGELSRMAIESSFRRRSYDVSFQLRDKTTAASNNRRLKINYLPLCLSLMGILLCQEQKLSYSVALMEPKLAKLLKMFGIPLIKVGGLIEFHGERAPYKIYNQDTYEQLRSEFQDFYSLLQEELGFSNDILQLPGLDPIHQPNYKNAEKTESRPPVERTLHH